LPVLRKDSCGFRLHDMQLVSGLDIFYVPTPVVTFILWQSFTYQNKFIELYVLTLMLWFLCCAFAGQRLKCTVLCRQTV